MGMRSDSNRGCVQDRFGNRAVGSVGTRISVGCIFYPGEPFGIVVCFYQQKVYSCVSRIAVSAASTAPRLVVDLSYVVASGGFVVGTYSNPGQGVGVLMLGSILWGCHPYSPVGG